MKKGTVTAKEREGDSPIVGGFAEKIGTVPYANQQPRLAQKLVLKSPAPMLTCTYVYVSTNH